MTVKIRELGPVGGPEVDAVVDAEAGVLLVSTLSRFVSTTWLEHEREHRLFST